MYIELKNINKSYGDFKASDNVNFEIEKGRLVALLGPSGSGKTTILRMIAGLEKPDSGEIIIDGKVVNDIPASERNIGFVFQSYALFRYMTVFDNIAFGLKVRKLNKQAINERVTELVKLTTRPSYPAVSVSVWHSRELLRRTRRCCCLTSHLRRSTQRCVRSSANG